MAIEVTCPTCSKRVRVQDEAAGKKFRCPHCQGIGDVPAVSTSAAVAAGTLTPVSVPVPAADEVAGGTGWRMKTPDGQIYGPVPKAELDEWLDEGRVVAECQLLRPASSVWEWASSIYPRLAAAAPGGAPPQPVQPVQPVVQPVMMPAANPYMAPNPYAAPNPFVDRQYAPMPGMVPVGYAPWMGPIQSDRSRIVAGLLAFFLGWLGVHNFYLGRNGLGTLQLLLSCMSCGILAVYICWPWSWIEAIVILAGGVNTDGDGRVLR